jgi:hypothetical protein
MDNTHYMPDPATVDHEPQVYLCCTENEDYAHQYLVEVVASDSPEVFCAVWQSGMD